MFLWLRNPQRCRRIVFLETAWACVRQVAIDGSRAGVEDGGCLVGVVHEGAESDTAFVSNVLRGTRRQRSSALLDSRPDGAEMADQMEQLDRYAGGLVYNLGRVHRHPGQMTQLSGTDTSSYETLCCEGELAGLLCPILTTSGPDKVAITGHIYVAGAGPFDVPVEIMALSDFLALWPADCPESRVAAARIVAASRWDVAGILDRMENRQQHLRESPTPAAGDARIAVVASSAITSEGASAPLPAVSEPVPLPVPTLMAAGGWRWSGVCAWVEHRSLGLGRSGRRKERGPIRRRLAAPAMGRVLVLLALATILWRLWNLDSRISALTESLRENAAAAAKHTGEPNRSLSAAQTAPANGRPALVEHRDSPPTTAPTEEPAKRLRRRQRE